MYRLFAALGRALKTFWLGLAMGVFVLVQELPAPSGTILALAALAVGATGAGCWFAIPRCPLRKARARVETANVH